MRRPPWLHWCGAAAFVVVTLAAAPAANAQAPPVPSTPSAAELRRKGAAASAGSRYQACVEAYSAALAVEKDHVTAAELGLCEEALGRFVQAHDHLLFGLEGEALEEDTRKKKLPGARPGPRPAWKRYRAAFERVSDRVARVIVFVRPNQAEVLLDGHSLGTRVSGRYFAVLPGEHTWSARLGGTLSDTVTHTVRAGDLPDITLIVEGGAQSPPADKGAPRTPEVWRSLPPEVWRSLPPEVWRSVPPEVWRSLPPQFWRALTPETWQSLPPEARRALPPEARPPRGAAIQCGTDCMEQLHHGFLVKTESGKRGRMDPTLVLIAGGLLSAGFTLDVGPGFWIGGEARWGAREELGVSLGAEVRALLPTKAGTRDAILLDLSLVGGAIAPCLRYEWAFGCVVVDAGVVIPGGNARVLNDIKVLAAVGFGPRLGADLTIVDRFGLRAFADLRISPIEEMGYRIGLDPLWRNPVVSGLFGLGVFFK